MRASIYIHINICIDVCIENMWFVCDETIAEYRMLLITLIIITMFLHEYDNDDDEYKNYKKPDHYHDRNDDDDLSLCFGVYRLYRFLLLH